MSGARVARFKPIRSKYDNVFFIGMTAAIVVAIFIGFTKSYFLRGGPLAPLPTVMVHLHAAAYMAWILFLILQVGLVTVHRVGLHRRLGMFGFGLAIVMVVLGIGVGVDEMARGISHGPYSPATFFVSPVVNMIVFTIFMVAAYRDRFQPVLHKRLILFATISILGPGIDRWHYAWVHKPPYHAQMIMLSFAIPILIYDLATQRRILRTTLWATVLFVAANQLRFKIGATAPFQYFANSVLDIYQLLTP